MWGFLFYVVFINKTIIMSKSYSKIRHIQQSNLLLEKRFINEEDEVVDVDGIASEDGVSINDVQTQMCGQSGIPPFIQKLIDRIPEDKREEANNLISQIIEKFGSSNFKIKELLSFRRQIKDEMKKTKSEVNEQLSVIIIAGITIPISFLIALGAILLIVIIWKIYSILSPKKCGFLNP